jgi:hypothetical protein
MTDLKISHRIALIQTVDLLRYPGNEEASEVVAPGGGVTVPGVGLAPRMYAASRIA